MSNRRNSRADDALNIKPGADQPPPPDFGDADRAHVPSVDAVGAPAEQLSASRKVANTSDGKVGAAHMISTSKLIQRAKRAFGGQLAEVVGDGEDAVVVAEHLFMFQSAMIEVLEAIEEAANVQSLNLRKQNSVHEFTKEGLANLGSRMTWLIDGLKGLNQGVNDNMRTLFSVIDNDMDRLTKQMNRIGNELQGIKDVLKARGDGAADAESHRLLKAVEARSKATDEKVDALMEVVGTVRASVKAGRDKVTAAAIIQRKLIISCTTAIVASTVLTVGLATVYITSMLH